MSSGASTIALANLPLAMLGCAARADDIKVRTSIALRAVNQSMIWIANEAGIFRKHGLDVTLPSLELAGPETTARLIRGEWEFCHTGALPIAESTLNGGDAVILLRNTNPNADLYVMTRREITELSQLDGRKVGVLSDAYSGQTYIGLGTYPNIYAALAAGKIDGGALPIDLRFSGARKYGWNAFATSAFSVPSVFASTRKIVGERRDMALSAVKGIVEAIHLFKTQSDVVVPILQDYLKIEDRGAAEQLRRYFAPLFPAAPRPALGEGMMEIRASLKIYPDAVGLSYPGGGALGDRLGWHRRPRSHG